MACSGRSGCDGFLHMLVRLMATGRTAAQGRVVTRSPGAPVVFRIPMRTRFRGQTFREGVLLHGPAVRDALGPAGRLRVDANGAWDTGEAVRRLKRLDRYDLEYAEQPCATLEELAAVRRACDVPIAADESIRRAEDPLRVRAAEAADVAVVKVQPLGGVRAALRVVEACGLPAVVSSAVETSVGPAAGLALAAALPALPYACGLGTRSLLSGDVVAEPLVPVGGRLAVRRPPVDFQHLSDFEIESPQWLRRMQEASR